MIKMNYLNEKNEIEEVCVIGYFGDSVCKSTTYVECYNEERGHFAAHISKLFSEQTTKDILNKGE